MKKKQPQKPNKPKKNTPKKPKPKKHSKIIPKLICSGKVLTDEEDKIEVFHIKLTSTYNTSVFVVPTVVFSPAIVIAL